MTIRMSPSPTPAQAGQSSAFETSGPATPAAAGTREPLDAEPEADSGEISGWCAGG